MGRECIPSFSLTVAYLEFANGHDCRLHRPVTLYSFRQKFCVAVLETDEGVLCGEKIGDVLDFIRAKLLVYDRPYYVVTLHPDLGGDESGYLFFGSGCLDMYIIRSYI